MAFGCVSNLLRASFLTLAVPLLLVGSLLTEVSRQLHLQSVNHLRYAIGEETASTGLQAAAEESAAGAVEQETEALEFEAEAARLQQMSAESEQAAIEQREADAGMEVDEGAGEAAAEGTQELSAFVDTAAEAAAAGDAAATDAAAGTAATAAAGTLGEAGEAGTAVAEEATAAAAVEGTEAVAAEGAAFAGGEAAAAEVGGVVAGPVGLAVAGAGVAAAAEAPKVVAAAQGLSAEFQADKDEVLAVEREAQVPALEADSMVEEGGAGLAHGAAWSSIAAAGGYYVSGELVQVAAFAFEAPIALVVLSQWVLGALAPVFGTLCGLAAASGSLPKSSPGSPMAIVSASGLAALTITSALGSLLLVPWAETVLYAAKLEAQDPTLTAIASLPQLYQEAVAKHQKNEVHQNLVKENSTARDLKTTRRLWPDWSTLGNTLKEDAEKAKNATEGALQAGEKAVKGAASTLEKNMPENVKEKLTVVEKVGQEAAIAAGKAAQNAAEQLKEKAKRLKNGNPDVHTTTVAPRQPEEAPNINHWNLLPQALSSIQRYVWSWALPVLRCIALASALVAFAELGIAAGRHYPAARSRSAGRHVILGRVLQDIYAQWVWGLALLIAVWVLSIILATSLRGLAEWVQLQHQSFAGLFLCVQLLLCTLCLAACSRLAWTLSQLEERTLDAAEIAEDGKDSSTDEERRLLEVESGGPSTARSAECNSDKVPARSWFRMASSMAASGFCFALCGVLDALLLAMENPVSTWALGASWKSLFTVRFLAGLLPWSLVAPTILGYKPSSPYELLAPIVAASFVAGGLLVLARRKNI